MAAEDDVRLMRSVTKHGIALGQLVVVRVDLEDGCVRKMRCPRVSDCWAWPYTQIDEDREGQRTTIFGASFFFPGSTDLVVTFATLPNTVDAFLNPSSPVGLLVDGRGSALAFLTGDFGRGSPSVADSLLFVRMIFLGGWSIPSRQHR